MAQHAVINCATGETTYEDGPDIDPVPDPVPESVSNFQGRTILRTLGIFDVVQVAISGIADATQRAISQDAFDRAEFNRKSPLLLNVAAQLGKDDAFIDEMFRQAAAIKV